MLSGLFSPNFPFLAVVPLVAGWLLGDWPVRRGVFLAVDVQQATEGLHWRYRAPGGPSQKALLVAELAQERYSAVVPSATLNNTACFALLWCAQSSKFDRVCPSLGSFPSIQSTRPRERFSTYQNNITADLLLAHHLTASAVGFFSFYIFAISASSHKSLASITSLCCLALSLSSRFDVSGSASRAVTSLILPAPPLLTVPSSLLPLPVRLPPRSTTTNNSSNLVTSSLTFAPDFCRSA